MDLLLTGFMGTGKTTVGRMLADRFAMAFVDTDEVIERHTGKQIEELFAEQGEDYFRSVERDVLRELQSGDGRVIATGGGLLADQRNHAMLAPHQKVLCLYCSPGEIVRRLGTVSNRPLLASPTTTEIERLLRDRSDAYERFDAIDTTCLSPKEVVDKIATTFLPSQACTMTIRRSVESTVHLERGAASRLADYLSSIGHVDQVMVVTDDTVHGLPIMGDLKRSLEENMKRVHSAVIPTGESAKSYATVLGLYQQCAAVELDRQAVIVGVGGGVVCDVAGFVASTYLRGLPLVLMPTTLLAQVDASIGGKTGIDFEQTKNLVGTFWPAQLIVIDPNALDTLPETALVDGMAEIVKVGFVRNAKLVDSIEELRSPGDVLQSGWIIRAASTVKAALVQRDPFERNERMLLNFGHTVGHAIESASDYRLSHGRAVSVGMVAELTLGVDLGLVDVDVLPRLRELLERHGLPQTYGETSDGAAMLHLARDKKRAKAHYRVALPTQVGEGKVFTLLPEQMDRAMRYAASAV